MIIVEGIEQGTEDWDDLRLGIPTGSKFATVKAKGRSGGESLTRTKYLYTLATQRITRLKGGNDFSSKDMDAGTETEPYARSAYMDQQDLPVREVAFIYLNEDRLVGVSPDGLVGDEGMLEIKCPILTTHVSHLLKDRLPPTYKSQVQGQLWVADRQWCDFVSYCEDSNAPLFVHRVERDEAYIIKLAESVELFLSELDEIESQLRRIAGP